MFTKWMEGHVNIWNAVLYNEILSFLPRDRKKGVRLLYLIRPLHRWEKGSPERWLSQGPRGCFPRRWPPQSALSNQAVRDITAKDIYETKNHSSSCLPEATRLGFSLTAASFLVLLVNTTSAQSAQPETDLVVTHLQSSFTGCGVGCRSEARRKVGVCLISHFPEGL